MGFIMKTISAVTIAAIIGSVAMHGADARLGRRLSPWGNGHSGRGPSKFDPTQGWYDEADQSVGRWYDEADQSVGSPWGNGQSGRGPSKFDPTQGWYDEADESVGRRRLSSSWLYTLATARLNSGPTGSCVATTLGNMDRLGIPSFSGGTTADPNNSRGAMVQMIRAGRWKSKNLPGSRWTTIRSAYGTAGAYVIGADAYEKMAYARQIPSGAIIFQTRWGWGANSGASGNDMGIVRDRGRYTFNYKLMNPIIYSNAKEVVILIPK